MRHILKQFTSNSDRYSKEHGEQTKKIKIKNTVVIIMQVD